MIAVVSWVDQGVAYSIRMSRHRSNISAIVVGYLDISEYKQHFRPSPSIAQIGYSIRLL